MANNSPIPDKLKTAVLIMDFQNDIVQFVTDSDAVLKGARTVLAAARNAKVPVIYVQARSGARAVMSPGTEFHANVAPAVGEPVLPKTKSGPFSTTGLDVLLREKGVDTLVIMGVVTSGCVLSAVRWAADINYKLVVVSDACGDRDLEVHRVLIEKVFPRQCKVITAQEFATAIGQA